MSILSVREAPGDVFVEKYAAHLKKQGKLELPSWVEYAKTGVARELAPLSEDWYYIRAGSFIYYYAFGIAFHLELAFISTIRLSHRCIWHTDSLRVISDCVAMLILLWHLQLQLPEKYI